jgi:DNA repair exonuclease SbcCD ATPase subunit
MGNDTSRTSLVPGTYRLTELAEKLNVSRKTAERYVERFSLDTTRILHLNKEVLAVVLDEKKIEELVRFSHVTSQYHDKGEDSPSGSPVMSNPMDPTHLNRYEEEIRTLRDLLETERIKNARLEGELQRIDETLRAQQSAIETSKVAIDALNNERVAIQYQLQKYRGANDTDPSSGKPWWKLW